MNRRNFLKAAAATPLAGLIPENKVSSNCPAIQGAFGSTYFRVDSSFETMLTEVHPNKRLYIDGRDVWTAAFEVDLVGQWVGVLKHRWEGTPWARGMPIERIWVHGRVEIK